MMVSIRPAAGTTASVPAVVRPLATMVTGAAAACSPRPSCLRRYYLSKRTRTAAAAAAAAGGGIVSSRRRQPPPAGTATTVPLPGTIRGYHNAAGFCSLNSGATYPPYLVAVGAGSSSLGTFFSSALPHKANSAAGAAARRAFIGGASGSGTKDGDDDYDDLATADDINVASLFKNPIVQQLWNARQQAKKRTGSSDEKTSEAADGDVEGKPPGASRVEVSYPFDRDGFLREAYRNPWNGLRLGRLFEDLDALAGNIAFFHADRGLPEGQQPIIVTASVDRIRLRERQDDVNAAQHLSGQVTWTGTSSMEIKMQFVREGAPGGKPWLEAYVTFVTLDRQTKRPTKIAPVVPRTDSEVADYAAGEARAAKKRERRKHHSGETYPDAVIVMAKELLAKAGPLLNLPSLADPHSILMSATTMQNAMIAQPQFQNLHSRIFGGFLLRRAFELAFATAYVFGGVQPKFLEVDEVSFQSPVDVGDLLVFNSRVVYTDSGYLREYYERSCSGENDQQSEEVPLIHVEVEAWVTVPEEAKARLSNQFYFTFAAADGSCGCTGDGRRVRTVLPGNIDEARRMASRIFDDHEQSKLI